MEEFPICNRCAGSEIEGMVLTCLDDICRGLGHCIHGDGWDVCPDCKGKGWIDLEAGEYNSVG